MMVSQISMSLLLTITENQIAKYIIERLTTPELTKMNQYWPQIVSNKLIEICDTIIGSF